jgi:excisionase family DNA binding protein
MHVRTTEYLSPAEFADLCGLSVETVRRRLRDGGLPRVQPGGPRTRLLIPADALDRALTAASASGRPDTGPGPDTAPQPPPTSPAPLPGPAPKWRRATGTR